MSIKNFLLKLSLFSSLFLGLGLLIFNICLPKYNFEVFPFLLAYFFGITLITHFILIKIENIRFARFSSYYMLITGIKMFVNLIFIGVYVYLHQKTAFQFLITFLTLYIAFTLFEVISILSHFKKKNSPPTIVIH